MYVLKLDRVEVYTLEHVYTKLLLAMLVDQVSIAPLIKAFNKFESFRLNTNTEQEKAGVIQSFEYCFELSWKTMKRLLEKRGQSAYSPREVFRMAALEGFISNPEVWFEFLRYRNLTTHTYQESEAEKVLSICPNFSKEVKVFLKNIGALDDPNA